MGSFWQQVQILRCTQRNQTTYHCVNNIGNVFNLDLIHGRERLSCHKKIKQMDNMMGNMYDNPVAYYNIQFLAIISAQIL